MKTRSLWIVALFLVAGAAGNASASESIPLAEATAPWLGMLKAKDAAVRSAAATALVDIVRKHPAAAGDLVKRMAAEDNGDVSAEHERRLVPLAKESPATVSALIRLVRESRTNYRARNFGVKVLSQVGSAAATPEFIEALAEKYCPVPGAFFRIMRALGKDAVPILAAGFRHPDPYIRNRTTIALRVIGRTEPTIQKLLESLQAEPPLLQKLREGAPADRVAAVAALVAGIRGRDSYRLRILALKVLPKVGATLSCKETVEALGDHYCPVPGMMRRILLAAGPDALPVLSVARKHANSEVRQAAENILQQMPRPAAVAGATTNP